MELSILVNKFNVKGRLVALQPFGNGNINDTYLAIYRNTFTETQVILQRVNRKVFPVPEAIMANMHEITKHCHEKLEADAKAGRDDRVWQMPRIIKAKDSKDYVADDNGEIWRVITRIMSAHAFDVADSGDIMVQKAPACTIGILAQAVKEIFGKPNHEVRCIGIRHGEKMYETLLTNEECANAIDMGNFYRVPCDKRGLNYDKYFRQGDVERNVLTEFNSSNTQLLDVEQVKEKLLKLKYIQDEIANF